MEYSFFGRRTVKISTPLTVPMNDYKPHRANRYGEPEEIQDIVQELTMSQDKSFTATVDKGNNKDQNGIKAAGKMMALQMKERVIPMKDKYTFERLAQLAGRVVGNSAKLAKNTVCERISLGTLQMDDDEVPAEGRTLYVSNSTYLALKHSDEFLGIDELGAKALAKGQVGKYDNMTVIKVPVNRWPKNVNFMIVYKNAATAPSKISETKLHQDPPGLSGNLMEGRFYYDVFVIGAPGQRHLCRGRHLLRRGHRHCRAHHQRGDRRDYRRFGRGLQVHHRRQRPALQRFRADRHGGGDRRGQGGQGLCL